MANATFIEQESIDLWKYKPNNDISVLLNMSIAIIYVSVVPGL